MKAYSFVMATNLKQYRCFQWVNGKQLLVYPPLGILFSTKMEQTTNIQENLHECPENFPE